MKRSEVRCSALALCSAIFTGCAASPPALALPAFTQGQTQALATSASYAILHSFLSAGGINPASKLLYYDGAFYGTAMKHGGINVAHSYGTIFRIEADGSERVLHRFENTTDGFWPMTGLTEFKGTLYGTTYFGANGACQGLGCGTIFSILPSGSHFRTLYEFTGNADGGEPNSDLTLLGGTLYGTTQAWDDGSCVSDSGCGTVYAFDIAAGTFKTLYAFTNKPNGNWPSGGLVAVHGTLYGTAMFGGVGKTDNVGYGGVFGVTPTGREHMVYRCRGNGDCSVPSGGLRIFHGKLYGTSYYDSEYYGNGVVFAVTPGGKEQTISTFAAKSGGANPQAPLTLQDGVLFGTTVNGGTYGLGTAFRVTPAGALRVLHNFGGPSDGGHPVAAMTFAAGKLYGTLPDGGEKNKGVVFSLRP